jgi:hypothetical protein
MIVHILFQLKSPMKQMIEVNQIQIAVLEAIEKGDSYSRVCKRLGWVDERGKADTSRLQRSIGLRTISGGYFGHRMESRTAVQIIRAIGRDPVEFGL